MTTLRATMRWIDDCAIGAIPIICLLLQVMPVPALRAQHVEDEAPADEVEDAPIVLAPFEVSTQQDSGYLAQNTVSGSRLNTRLQDTPAPTSVFTAEFMADIGATSISDLSEYAINTERNDGTVGDVANGNNLAEFDATFRIRGLPTDNGGGRSINFFKYGIEVDAFSTERVEFSRGPNSILFGLGSAAGAFNVSTKKADVNKAKQAFTLRIGDYDAIRAHLDSNIVLLPGKLGLRVNLLDESKNGWRPHEFKDATRVHGTLKFQITPRTSFDFEVEHGTIAQSVQRPWVTFDGFTDWLAAGSPLDPAPGTPFPGGVGIGLLSGAPWVTYDSTTGSIYNWQRMTTTVRIDGNNGPTSVPMLFDFDLVPKDTVVGGTNVGGNIDYTTFSAFLRHEVVDNLFIELAYNQQDSDFLARDIGNNDVRISFDTNAKLPDGSPNPNAGQPFVESVIIRRDRYEDIDDLRATISYELDLGDLFGRHRVAGLVEQRNQDYARLEMNEFLVDGAANLNVPENGQNRFHRRTYVDLSGPVADISLADFRTHDVNGLVNQSTGQAISTAFFPNANVSNDRLELASRMVVAQSSFWGDRLIGTFGYREDDLDNYLSSAVRGDPFGPYRQGIFHAERAATPVRLSGVTRTQGGVFRPLPWISFFYNQSSNFSTPNPQITTLPKDAVPPPKGEGKDYGLKFNLLDGRVFATFSYYETTAKDDGAFMGRNNENNLNSIWNTLDQAGLLAPEGLVLDDQLVNANGYTFDSASEGYEVEVVANLTDRWRLSLSAADNQTVNSNIAPAVLDYLDTYRGLFEAGTNGRLIIDGNGALAPTAIDPSDGSNNTVAELLQLVDADVTRRLIEPNGTRQLGSSRYSSNLRTNYTFGDGALKGFSVGGGARWRSAPVIGYTSSDPAVRELIDGEGYVLFDLNAGYRRRLQFAGGKFDWSLQLNVNNLFNDDDIVVSRAYSDGTPRLYRLQTPREWFLSSTIKF